jgi:RNA polymerase sigma-70 factor (ECF subfamily)
MPDSIPDSRPDQQWLRAIRAGDEAAFLALYREHQGPIYRFALRMTGDAGLAEDVVQEVFLTLLGSLRIESGYDPERGSLAGYLFGIARNLVRRRLQARGRWRSFDDDEGSEESWGGEKAHAVVDPLRELTRRETIEAVRQAVLALPEHYREAIVLCDLHEMSYQEAAEVLDCSLGTVRSRLHRGRLLLLDRIKSAQMEEPLPDSQPELVKLRSVKTTL